jgi:hypothetical protein
MTTRTNHRRRLLALTVGTLLMSATGALSAAARPDPGSAERSALYTTDSPCPLERVGTQFVRCDDLTGNGVPAPAWVRHHDT